jgi:putative acetyltransferase
MTVTDGEIVPADPRDREVHDVLARHLAFTNRHSPPEDMHALDLDGLLDPDITFFCLRSDGRLTTIGALRHVDVRQGELKSMHTVESARGRGHGRAMVDHLVATARDRGYRRLWLETGSMESFGPVRALYAACGFVPCGPFPPYVASVNSVFMTLDLDAGPAVR